MRFDSPKPKVPILNRRDQLRIVLLILALALVAGAMIAVSSPAFVERLGRWFGSPDEQQSAGDSEQTAREDDVFRSPPGEVVIEPAPSEEGSRNDADAVAQPGEGREDVPHPSSLDDSAGTEVSRETSEPGEQTESEQPATASPGDWQPLIEVNRLTDLQDAVAVTLDEMPLLLYTLSTARDAEAQRIEEEALRGLRLVNLTHRPDFYRGQVVEVAGFIQSIERQLAPENEDAVQTYWRVWLLGDVPPPEPLPPAAAALQGLEEDQPAEVPPPLLVCTVEDPATSGLAVGERVRLVGFFFKSVPVPEDTSGWEFQPDVPSAPLIVARRMNESLIDRQRLADVDDHRLGITYSEGDAFYYTLATAARHGGELDGAGERGIGFGQLWEDPGYYRGKPIELVGRCVMLRPIRAGSNRFGIREYYEAGIFTEGVQHPYIVNVLEVPDAMPRGAEIDERVRVTAFFFKKYYYRRSDNETQGAPLLLGYRLRWQPAAAAESVEIGAIFAAVFLFVGLVLGIAVWRFSRSDRRFRQTRSRVAATSARDIEALRNLEGTEPEEHLRELEREDR